MNQPRTTEALFNDISKFISDSRELLKRGAVMELSGLDDNVKELCEEVMRLSQDDRLQHADRLQELFAELKLLGEELSSQRDSLADDIRGASDHKKATAAYRSAPAGDGSGSKE
ncbi:MAG: hypothetical protein ACN2B6_04950 [Rickettsiales bacterium]